MVLQDSNAERRNLTVLAVSIIVYFLAGGVLTSGTVRLQIINVEFQNPEVLMYFVWVLLLWFCFRYWLLHNGTWKEPFKNELTDDNISSISTPYLLKRFGLGDDYSLASGKNGRHWVRVYRTNSAILSFQHIYKDTQSAEKIDSISIETVPDYIMMARCTMHLFFTKPALSNYFVPYILFLWAIGLGVKATLYNYLNVL